MTREAHIWRQLTAITVAWLFALQVMLSSLAAVVSFSNYQGDQTTGFTLCLHDGVSSDLPTAPSPSIPCDHCPFCLAIGHAAIVAVVALLIVVAYFCRLRWVSAGIIFSAPLLLDGARSRGPPLQA